ncbi:MAG: ACT domain-containing protein [Nitrospirota bacterium]
MAKAKKAKQLTFSMPDRAGLLSDITAVIAEAKVNINAICAYAMENKAFFMMITESNARAKKALGKINISPQEEDVLMVEMPNTVGSLHRAAKKIADAGVNINYLFATAASGRTSTCVLNTSDDKKALRAVSK